jgi:excisionase family DNA binding protein
VSATLTIPEAADLLGVGRNLAYEIATRDGELAGVPVIRVGRRLLIPQARLLAVLGLTADGDNGDKDGIKQRIRSRTPPGDGIAAPSCSALRPRLGRGSMSDSANSIPDSTPTPAT